MSDPAPIVPASAKSPTGTPRVKPSAVPWLTAVLIGVAGGLEVATTALPNENAKLGCRIAAVTLVGILGAVSPGWRRR